MSIDLIDCEEELAEERLRKVISQLRPRTIAVKRFHQILLQRQWLSYEFTAIYDIALNMLTENVTAVKPTIRKIIREEYPNDREPLKTPSHREDMVSDLLAIGIKHKSIRNTAPSHQTQEVITSARAAILEFAATERYSDVMLLAFLRFWGEVLTAVEYEVFRPRLKTLLPDSRGCFYYYHMTHDKRARSLAEIANGDLSATHADLLGNELILQLNRCKDHRGEAITHVIESVKRSMENKISFYLQFQEPSLPVTASR